MVDDSLLITPGDADDMIRVALEVFRAEDKTKRKLSGIILSGGIMPEKPVLDLLAQAQLPVLLAGQDTYTVSSMIHDLTVKIRPENLTKINTAVKLIRDYVDLERILKGI
jgi:phosphate acetyltransferase